MQSSVPAQCYRSHGSTFDWSNLQTEVSSFGHLSSCRDGGARRRNPNLPPSVHSSPCPSPAVRQLNPLQPRHSLFLTFTPSANLCNCCPSHLPVLPLVSHASASSHVDCRHPLQGARRKGQLPQLCAPDGSPKHLEIGFVKQGQCSGRSVHRDRETHRETQRQKNTHARAHRWRKRTTPSAVPAPASLINLSSPTNPHPSHCLRIFHRFSTSCTNSPTPSLLNPS